MTKYPVSMFQSVEKVEKKDTPVGVGLLDNLESGDKFQPLALIKELREKMGEVYENATLDERYRDGIRLGLAWAITIVNEKALAKDRFSSNK